MRRGLGSLLAVWVVMAGLGLTVASAAALAAGRSARSHPRGHIKRSSPAHRASLPRPRGTGDRPVSPGAGYDSPVGSGAVRVLQRRLTRAGDPPGPVDGRYGPLTEHAVARFQAAHGLQVDGIAGPRTWAALNTPTDELFPTAGYHSPAGSAPVRTLQRRLTRAGDSPGPIDGRYGPLTEHAVARFQAAHGLPVDGIARPQTLIDLTSLPTAQRPRAASPQPRSRPGRAQPKVAARPPVRAPAPTPVRVAPPHGHSSPAKWLLFLGILALGVLLRRWRAKRSSSVPIPPPDTIIALPRAEFEPHPPRGSLAPAEDDRTPAQAGWRRDETPRAQTAYRSAPTHGKTDETQRAHAARFTDDPPPREGAHHA